MLKLRLEFAYLIYKHILGWLVVIWNRFDNGKLANQIARLVAIVEKKVCATPKGVDFWASVLPHTSRFFVVHVVELQIFCWGQIGLKFVGTSACRRLANFLSRLTAIRLRTEPISAMLEKTLGHVTLMAIPHWLRYPRAPTNCLGSPHTSRQGPTRRFEI